MYELGRRSLLFLINAPPVGQLGYAQVEYLDDCDVDEGYTSTERVPEGENPICIDRAEDDGDVDGVEFRLDEYDIFDFEDIEVGEKLSKFERQPCRLLWQEVTVYDSITTDVAGNQNRLRWMTRPRGMRRHVL